MTTIARALEVSRSNLYERKFETLETTSVRRNRRSRQDDVWLLPMIREVSDSKPTYGYRRVTTMVRRVLRLQGKSLVNAKRIFRIMRENGLALRRHTARPAKTHDGKIITLKSDLRWCSDGFRIQCWNGEKLNKVPHKIQWLTDNSPGYVADDTVAFGRLLGLEKFAQ